MKRVLHGLVLAPVYVYRYCISPFTPGSCRFQPTCSAYSVAAVRRHGVWRGGWLSLRRLARCHPWGGAGYDPIPDLKHPPA